MQVDRVQLHLKGELPGKSLANFRALPHILWGGLVVMFTRARDCFSQPYLWEEE
jgi:hypothetical protein